MTASPIQTIAQVGLSRLRAYPDRFYAEAWQEHDGYLWLTWDPDHGDCPTLVGRIAQGKFVWVEAALVAIKHNSGWQFARGKAGP